MKRLILTVLAMSLSTPLLAEGFYLGAGIGNTDFDDGGAYKDVSTAFTSEPKGETYKLIAGYTFNKIIGLEAQYTKYGKIKNSFPLLNINTDLKHTSAVLSANIGYTFNNGIRPFGTIGLGSIEAKSGSWNDSGTAYRAGIGLEFSPESLDELSFRVAYEVDMYTIEISDVGISKKEYDMTMSSIYFSTSYKF